MINSLFHFTKKCLVFSIRKTLSERSSKIFEKINVLKFVFNIVIWRTNRFCATLKFEIFFDSNVLDRSKNAAWNDFNVSILINAIEYVYFRNLIFMIIASANIIIDCLFFLNLIDKCNRDSFSILKFKIDWFWTKFKISFIFKSIWKRNIVSIIFSLNF